MGGGFRLDNRQRSSDNLRALFSIFSGYLGISRAQYDIDLPGSLHWSLFTGGCFLVDFLENEIIGFDENLTVAL